MKIIVGYFLMGLGLTMALGYVVLLGLQGFFWFPLALAVVSLWWGRKLVKRPSEVQSWVIKASALGLILLFSAPYLITQLPAAFRSRVSAPSDTQQYALDLNSALQPLEKAKAQWDDANRALYEAPPASISPQDTIKLWDSAGKAAGDLSLAYYQAQLVLRKVIPPQVCENAHVLLIEAIGVAGRAYAEGKHEIQLALWGEDYDLDRANALVVSAERQFWDVTFAMRRDGCY